MEMSGPFPRPARHPARAGEPRWSISAGTFERFLAGLDPDREKAAERYEQMRQRLVVFFSVRDVSGPEDQADVTLDRVCRRMDEGEPIQDVAAYVLGVARRIELESRRRSRQERRLSWLLRTAAPADRDAAAASEHALRCVDACLEKLPAEDRELLLRYYRDDKRAKIEDRRRLAEGLGLSPGALRLRAFRIRGRLEPCVRECLARGWERERTRVAPPPEANGK
jgi:DNA-directed RNA polymerase specialized sigma24 family protein